MAFFLPLIVAALVIPAAGVGLTDGDAASDELKMLIAEQYVDDQKNVLSKSKHTKYDSKDAFDWYGIKKPSKKTDTTNTVYVTIQKHADFIGNDGKRFVGWIGIKTILTSYNDTKKALYSGQEVKDAFKFEMEYEDIFKDGAFDFSLLDQRLEKWDVYCDDVMYRARIKGKKMDEYLDFELTELEAAELGYNGRLEKLTDSEIEGYYGDPKVEAADPDLGDSIEFEGSKSSNDVVYGDGNNVSSYAATASHIWEEADKFNLWKKRMMDTGEYELAREKYLSKYSHFAKEDWLNDNFELRTFVEVLGMVKDKALIRKSILQSGHSPSDLIKCGMYLRDLGMSEGLPSNAYALCKKLEELAFDRKRRVAAEIVIRNLNGSNDVKSKTIGEIRGNAELIGDVWKLIHTMSDGKESFDFSMTYELTSEYEVEDEETGLITYETGVETVESKWSTRVECVETYNRLKEIKNEVARLTV